MKRDRLNLELVALERKVRLLLNEFDVLKKSNEQLKEENRQLEGLIKSKEKQLNDFQNKYKISTIVDRINVGDEEIREVKEKINDYIKEIDRCIHQMSK
jgi:hypothetical protein